MKSINTLILATVVVVGSGLAITGCATDEAPAQHTDRHELLEQWTAAWRALEEAAPVESKPFLLTYAAEVESRRMLRLVSEQAELELTDEERAAEAAAVRDLETAAPAEYERFDEIWQFFEADPGWIADDDMVLGLYELMEELQEAAPAELEALAGASRAQEGKFGVIAAVRLWLAVRDARGEARAVLFAAAPDELLAFEARDLVFEATDSDRRIAALAELATALEPTN